MRQRHFNSIGCLAAGCVLLLPALGWGGTAPLAGDAFINTGDAANYGGLTTINIGGAPASKGLLLFDLSHLSGGASNVAWARLRFYVSTATVGGAVDIAAASASWAEASVSGVGGPSAGAAVASGVAIGSTGWVTVDVTAQLISWLNGSPNNGLILTANPSSTTVFLDSKESVSTSHAATLEVVFSGAAGPVGPAGPAGPAGATGVSGAAGPTGPVGDTGPQGPAGPPGPSGPQGPGGPPGGPGANGPAGAAGPAGPAGAPGAAGPTGPPGPAGATGATGAAGPTGGVGPTGFTGSNGPPGATGATGAIGTPFSNTDYQDPTTLANGAVIGDADTHFVFLVNNSAVVPTVSLPHANSGAGKQIRLQATVPYNGHTLNIVTQGSDGIWDAQAGGPALTSFTPQGGITLVSDGGTRWLVLWTN